MAPWIGMSAQVRDLSGEVWGWCFPKHDKARPPSPSIDARVLTLMYDGLYALISYNYKRNKRKEIADGHLVSVTKFVRKRQRLTKDLLHTVNYFFLTDYK